MKWGMKMNSIASVRLTIPKASGEIKREKIIETITKSKKKLIYIHAGAGYGKTTLLSQIARSSKLTVWLTLAGESDLFTFMNALCEAIKQTFPNFDFIPSEYVPLAENHNFITVLSNAFICSVEKLGTSFVGIVNDLHTIQDEQIKELICSLMAYTPDNIRIFLCSREAPWQELIALTIRGDFLEVSQTELAFSREEVTQILGFDDAAVYKITEGWPLAVGSLKLLLEKGVCLAGFPMRGKEALYSYLYYEYLHILSPDIIVFLRDSACFDELEPHMLDIVLNRENSKQILENLVLRNMFTIKTDSGHYRYHSLFREYLLNDVPSKQCLILREKAAQYFFYEKKYFKAAEYAIDLENKESLEKIIIACYKEFIRVGNYSSLHTWFHALGTTSFIDNPELLLAKGVFCSSIGDFIEANACLDKIIPAIKEDDYDMYMEAMVHKARVLRNFTSIEESNDLLDLLIEKLDSFSTEIAYSVVIEKLYNLCWTSKIDAAFSLAYQMIECCARDGNKKIKSWIERYLTVIHFFAGHMKKTVYYYEKSCCLSVEEQMYLNMHSIGIYAAKAYQMLGEQNRAFTLLSLELQQLRSTGKIEELWSAYLLAAEIYYQKAFTDMINGQNENFETTIKYFTLANEFAPLYRKTKLQNQWVKVVRLTYSLIFTNGSSEKTLAEIYENMEHADDYLKSIVYARLMGYFSSVSKNKEALKCARMCINIGFRSHIMLHATMALGVLAKDAIIKNDSSAIILTRKYLRLCSENGFYDQFKIRKLYDLIIKFAAKNDIESDFVKQMIAFSGFKEKKVYVETLGGFAIFPNNDRTHAIKMRTKKERELLAFLLDAGARGATKDQIYHAIWTESESVDIKKLIGVNLAQIKKDLGKLGIDNPIICKNNRYYICRDQIECDFENFEEAAATLKLKENKKESINIILYLYKGEYLSTFEALWATSKKIKYREIFEHVLAESAG